MQLLCWMLLIIPIQQNVLADTMSYIQQIIIQYLLRSNVEQIFIIKAYSIC